MRRYSYGNRNKKSYEHEKNTTATPACDMQTYPKSWGNKSPTA